MLQTLTIRDIVLIEHVTLELGPGLTVLTGETGAGKSILLDALGLVLGNRAEKRLVRQSCDHGMVSAEFQVAENRENHPPILQFCTEHDIPVEEDMLVLRRVVQADGKSRAFINDIPVSRQLLQQLGNLLVEINGQHETRGLLDVSTHRTVLDAYGKHSADLARLQALYATWQKAQRYFNTLKEDLARNQREEDYLTHLVNELHELNPQPEEEATLAEERIRLQSQEKLHDALSEALSELEDNPGILTKLAAAERKLQRTTGLPEETIAPLLEALDRASIETQEATRMIQTTLENTNADPTLLDQVEERLFSLRAAARKYQVTVDELPLYLKKQEAALNQLHHAEATLQDAQQLLTEAKTSYQTEAKSLHAKREKAANALEKAVLRELAPLKMEHAGFQVRMEIQDEAQWGPDGIDRIRFEVRTNPGAPFGPMGKIASGGELSRFMLAIKVGLSGVYALTTVMFDEVDTGVGGAVADAIGERLAMLGRETQVLCVTHQPQVASKGRAHLRVEKLPDKGGLLNTHVTRLEGSAREEEIARMLAGAKITDEARAAAIRLLEAA